jgi:hypothetical protein
MARPFTVYIECHQARSAAIPTSPPQPSSSESKVDADKVSLCLKIQREELAMMRVCFSDEFRRLAGNKTEPATVVADAIIRQCRSIFLYGRNERTLSLKFCQSVYDQSRNLIDKYFSDMRATVVDSIISLRTD